MHAQRTKPVPRTCVVCGAGFTVPASLLSRGGNAGNYCSRACFHRSRVARVETTCATCGIAIEVVRCQHKARNYCGLKCAHDGHRATKDEWVKPLNERQRAGLQKGRDYFRGKTRDEIPSIGRRVDAIAAQRRGKPNPAHAERMRRYYADHPEKHPNAVVGRKGRETGIERAMRLALIDAGVSFETQHRVGRYWVDFAVVSRRLAIEVDGAHWHDAERDSIRDRKIAALGWAVVRFPEDRIKSDPAACAAVVVRLLA